MSESSPPRPQGPGPELSGRISKYEIVRPLGKGAMGMVYLAHDTILERDVALKVMVAAIADDPELKKRFEREARAVAKLSHPNIVMVFDLGYHTDGSPFLAMELLKGSDLQKAMRQPPPMSLERKASVILNVLAGLAHAHQAGIVHRDIKPANIFIHQDGGVKIMDFGVARLTTASMTGTGNIVGTADYMSPEQVKGAKVDGRSDIFSVGCMLYELLTGRRPFHSDNLMAIFYKITHEEPNFDLVPQGAEYDALMPILKKSLAKNLENRYQSAYDFAVELRDYLRHHATSASAENALDALAELEPPPTTPPPPLTDPGSMGVSDDSTQITAGTQDLGTGARRARTTAHGPASATYRAGGAATVLGAGSGPTVVTREAPPRYVPPKPRPAPAPSGGSPVLYVVLGAMGVALLGLGGYVGYQKLTATPPTTLAAVTPTTQPAPPPTTPTPAPPPPTVASRPTFTVKEDSKAAVAMKAGQAAFGSQDYRTAVTRAQEALRLEPSNADARRLLDNATAGQNAEARFRSAESALRAGDFDRAAAEAEAGRQAAPWDSRGPNLLDQVQRGREAARRAEQQQQQQAAAAQRNQQIATLLGKADEAVGAKKFDVAINLYDEVLKLDPANARAGTGRTGAITAKALTEAAASSGSRSGPAGRSFVAGKTTATAGPKPAGNVPPGFEDTPGVEVKKSTVAADLPGRVLLSVQPAAPKTGDEYRIQIEFANDGNAPIQVASMLVTSEINGKKNSGPMTPQVREVAPHDRAQLQQLAGNIWREDTSSWSFQVTVRTTRGEVYQNEIQWK